MKREDASLVELGLRLKRDGYTFTTITPETHKRLNRRPENAIATSIEDILGWSRAFRKEGAFQDLAAALENAGALVAAGELFRSAVRYSTLGANLFVHSAFPTIEADSVFFGPDTYRFVRTIRAAIARFEVRSPRRIVDVGCGAGAGGIVLAGLFGERGAEIVLSDVNQRALRHSEINVKLADAANVSVLPSDVLDGVTGSFDLIVSNPPYIADPTHRRYRDGGGNVGTGLSLRIVRDAVARLAPGGMLVLYTGAPVRDGRDLLMAGLEPILKETRFHFEYEEIDPDVFGDELESGAYAHIDRISVVSLIVRAPE